MNKKGYSLGQLPQITLLFIISVLVLSIIGDIVANVFANQTGTGVTNVAKNVSGSGLFGLKQIGLYLPTIGIVLAAAIIISVLISAFAFGGRK